MSTLFNLSEGIVSLSKFRQSAKEYLKRLQKTREPIVLTQNGQSAAVVMSPQSYQRLEYERDLYRAVAQGEKDIAQGKLISHQDLFRELLP